jgi:hypothetical protein
MRNAYLFTSQLLLFLTVGGVVYGAYNYPWLVVSFVFLQPAVIQLNKIGIIWSSTPAERRELMPWLQQESILDRFLAFALEWHRANLDAHREKPSRDASDPNVISMFTEGYRDGIDGTGRKTES